MISKENGGIRASPKVLSMQRCKKFSHPSLIIYFFQTPPIKLKLGLQIGGRLITTHLDQSNHQVNPLMSQTSEVALQVQKLVNSLNPTLTLSQRALTTKRKPLNYRN
jgi:hypothetical protein